MELTDENKRFIDSLSHYDLLRKWRFGLVGDSWFQGETDEYWKRRLEIKREENPSQAIQDSKEIGWG